MKNILIILILSFFYINIGYTNEPCYEGGGFLTVEKKFVKKVTFKDPKNTLVFIHSHGGSNDKSKSGCPYKMHQIKQVFELTKEDFGRKENFLYLLDAKKIAGDMYIKYGRKGDKMEVENYEGKTKLQKRIDQVNELILELNKQGIKNKNIIVSGKSCGAWMTLLYQAKFPSKVAGGIAYHPACYDKLNKKNGFIKVEKYKSKAYLNRRQADINEISKSKNLKVIAFTNRSDPHEGGDLSDWMNDVIGLKFIDTPGKSEKFTLNGKRCKEKNDPGHNFYRTKCMKDYFPEIVKYFK